MARGLAEDMLGLDWTSGCGSYAMDFDSCGASWKSKALIALFHEEVCPALLAILMMRVGKGK
jgi:hypothetical protein